MTEKRERGRSDGIERIKEGKGRASLHYCRTKKLSSYFPLKKRDFLSHIFFEEYSISEVALLFFPHCCMISPPIYDNRICEDALSLFPYISLSLLRGKKRRRKMHTRRPKKKRYPISAMGFAGLKGGERCSCSLSLLSPFQATLFPFSPSSYSVHGSSGRRRYTIRQRLRNLRPRCIAIWKDGWILVMPSFPFSQKDGGGGGEAEISRRKRTREGEREGGWLWSRKKGKEEEEEESIKHEAWLGEVCCFLIRSPFSLFLLGVRGPWDRRRILSPIYTLPER